ncbi:MAG: hypothetical protein NTX25_11585 [Proteobacteria bacterium]|nr:hypothetical protein [Pseudomonadota bacterium]
MPRFKLAGTACPFLAHLGLIALLCGCIKAQGDKNIQTKVPLSPIEKKPGLINPPETPNTNEKKPDNKPSCTLPDTASRFRLAPPAAAAGAAKPSFADIQGLIDGACKSCHLAPAANFGGFTYANSYRSQKLIINEKQLEVPGYFESAEKLRDVLLKGSMPPENIRQKKSRTVGEFTGANHQ